ncbi:hypothetical protein UPYG_G00275330 [Umbra pygmaea]|uniref:UBX domain-containing protein n=1 Tax=Umbra pygmaea TaxID=75934 RepID=A0ABD0W6I5_UMBPY
MSSSNCLLWTVSISFICFVSWKHSIIDVRGAFLLAGCGLLLLGLSSLVSYLYPVHRSVFSETTETTQPLCSEDELKRRQKHAREELQKKHNEKASSYKKSVLRLRQERPMRKKEEHFYRMPGQTLKLSAEERLGEGELSGKSAIRRRKLPESATRVHPKPEAPFSKRVVVLPEEPPEDAKGVVRVVLRCPSGRTVHRRFLKSDSSSVLLDWMLRTGYHPTLYTLYISYPGQPLNTRKDTSMEDAGILTHTVLDVGEKDLLG